MRRWALGLLVLAAAAFATAGAAAQPRALRVGTSGDYPPFSEATAEGDYRGFGPELVRAFAADHGYAIEFVRFRWPELTAELADGRFDVAVGGITVRADRALVGGFTVAVAESGAMVLADPNAGLASVADLARPGLPMAVNAGGHLERVARLRFPAAALRAIPDNAAVLAALEAGEVDAVVTDTVEARLWARGDAPPVAIGPLTRDQKAWWVAPGRDELARELNEWLLARAADDSLRRARGRHGIPGDGLPGSAARALVTAIGERLALMPAVAEAKRLSGGPVHVPEREALVIEAAVTRAREAAQRAGLRAPEDAAVAAFMQELIAAARAVQEAVHAGPPAETEDLADLDAELRPALLRIGDRIALLVPRLPARVAEEAIAAELAATVDLPGLDAERHRRLVRAVVDLAAAPRH